MGIIQVPGRISGKTYDVKIKGDTPSDTEQARIRAYLDEQENAYVQNFSQRFGFAPPEPDDGTAIGRGVSRGAANVKSSLGTTVETIGQQTGIAGLAEYGRGMEDAAKQRLFDLSLQQPAPTTRQDVAAAEGFFPTIGKALTYAGEVAGEQVTQLGASLVGGGAGAIAGGVTGGVPGAIAGFGVGSGLVEAPMLFGANVQRQEEEVAAGRKDRVDLTDALASTVGQAGLTAVTNAMAGAGIFVRPGATLFTRAAMGAAVGGSTEALNEVGQQVLERYQAGLPIDSEDAIAEYIDAGLAGGILGMGAGGLGGAVGGPRVAIEEPPADTREEPPVVPPEEAAKAEDIAAAVAEVTGESAAVDEPLGATPATDTATQEDLMDARDVYDERMAIAQEGGASPAEAERIAAQAAINYVDSLDEATKGRLDQFRKTMAKTASAPTQLELTPAAQPREAIAPVETEADAFERAAQLAVPEAKYRKAAEAGAPAVAPEPKYRKEAEAVAAKQEQLALKFAPEVAPADTTKTRNAAPMVNAPKPAQVLTDDLVTQLGVKSAKSASLRKLVGKPLTDTKVIQALNSWAQNDRATPENKDLAARLITGQPVPEAPAVAKPGPAIWANADFDLPVEVADAAPQAGPDGRFYPQVIDPSTKQPSSVPLDELRQAGPSPVKAQPATTLQTWDTLKPGDKVTLYRGENQDNTQGGDWWTTNPEKAAQYGAVRSFTVDALDVGRVAVQGHGGTDEFFFPEGVPTRFLAPTQEAPNVTETAEAKPEEVGAGVPSGGPSVEGSGRADDVVRTAEGAETPAEGGLGGNLPVPDSAAEPKGVQPDTLIKNTPNLRSPLVPQPTLQREPGMDIVQAGQVIPAPVRVPQAQTMSPAQRVTAQQLDQAIATRYAAATPLDVKRGAKFLNERGAQGTTPDKATIADKQVVVNLLATRDDLLPPQAKAAKLYFSKVARPMEAVLMIVDDLSAPYGKYRAEPGTDPFTRAFLAETGSVAAKQAREFIKARMSKELNRELDFRERLSAQQNKNIETWVADIDRVELKRAERKAARTAQAEAAVESGYGPLVDKMASTDPLAALDKGMHYSVKAALDAGDLKGALQAVAATTNNADLRALAAKFAGLTGTTRVKVLYAGDSAKHIGTARGIFLQNVTGADPDTQNIILINGYTGMTTHVLMHEMAHAVTSSLIDLQPNHPVVKQLSQLLENVRAAAPKGTGYYNDFNGLLNIKEMVADAYGRVAMGRTDNGLRDLMKATNFTTYTNTTRELPLTNWERFKEIIGNFMRGLVGRPAKAYPRRTVGTTIESHENALDRFHRLVDGLLSEAPQVVPAYAFQQAWRSPLVAKTVLNNAIQSAPVWDAAGRTRLAKQLKTAMPMGARRALLGLLHLDWFNDLAGKYFPQIAKLKELDDLRRGEVLRLEHQAKPVLQDLQAYAEKQPELYLTLSALMGRATLAEVDPTLASSVYAGDKDKLDIWHELSRELKTHDSTGKMRELFIKVREMKKATRGIIRESLELRVKDITDDVTTQKQLVAQLIAKLDEEGAIDPYFALMREGDYWMSYTAEDTTAAPVVVDPASGASKRPTTQYVQAFTSYSALQQFRAKLEAAKDANGQRVAWDIEEFRRPKTYNPDAKVPAAFVQGALNIIDSLAQGPGAISADRKQQAIAAIQDMFVRFTPEHSVMKSFTKRKGTRGFIGDITPLGVVDRPLDMVQLLAKKTSGLAYQAANMKYGGKIQALVNDADKTYKTLAASPSLSMGDKMAVEAYHDEFVARAKFAQSPRGNAVSQTIRGVTFGMTLGGTIAGAVNNLAQIPMIGATELAGRYGMGASLRELGSATRLLMNAGKTYKVRAYGVNGMEARELSGADNFGSMANYFEVDDAGNRVLRKDKNIPAALRSKLADLDVLVEVMDNNGMLASSMAQEMLDADAGVLHKINRWSGFLMHHAERYNRQTMAIAAYNLELGKLKTGGGSVSPEAKLEAAKKAILITERVNGSIGASTAPRAAQGPIGQVVFMFKRFGLQMARYIIGTTNQAIRGMSKEDRAVARYQIIGMLGTTALFAGVQGLPFFSELMSLFNLFFTDDEDEPAEVVIQKYLQEPFYHGAINYLTGAEVSSRISMSGLIFRENKIEKDQSALYDLVDMLGGPAIGVFMNAERGAGLLAQGELYRGVEAMMPSAIKSVMKAARYSTEGATTLRGDEVVPLSVPDIALQALGYTPGAYARMQERVSGEKRISEAVLEKKRKLLRKYNMAARDGDFETIREILADMREFTREHPEAAITPTTLEKSNKSFLQRSSEMLGGVSFAKSYLPRAQQSINEEFDQDLTIWGS